MKEYLMSLKSLVLDLYLLCIHPYQLYKPVIKSYCNFPRHNGGYIASCIQNENTNGFFADISLMAGIFETFKPSFKPVHVPCE